MLEPSKLKKLFHVDFATGQLKWKHRPVSMFNNPRECAVWNARYEGKVAGFDDPAGYRLVSIENHKFKLHRVVWAMAHGEWPNGHIDHINGQKSDNRLLNLRVVTKSENGRNSKMNSANSSGAMGVSWVPERRKWQAYITVDGRRKSLGRFPDIKQAIDARKAAELEHNYHQNHGRCT